MGWGTEKVFKQNKINGIMGIVLLRKLTMKSIIGFGNYKDLTVQDLCNLQRHKELISIYYKLGNIDFADDVKTALFINNKREIKKPGKDYTAYMFFVNTILSDIIENGGNHHHFLSKMARADKYLAKGKNKAWENKINSPIRNRDRNQKK